MRLINCRTRHLEEFFGQNIPPYAILSHTWEEQELSFKEYYNPKAHLRHPKSAAKLFRTCERAIQDGYEFVWVDSCCIDKSSSAELSEAINSMFKWYGAARRCYAYLSDFDFDELRGDDQPIAASLNAKRVLSKCRWFYRGWTLQELLAPRDVWFFDCHWRYFGSRLQISSILSEITTIPEPVFKTTMSRRYSEYSIAQRMSWAAGRQTTREEDIAYCLFGIFHVNLPLLYGEGGERAFIRLQEEIMKESNDLTLFAWSSEGEQCCRGLLARSPREFASAGDIHSKTDVNKNPEFTLTNKGLRIETSILRLPGPNPTIFMPLNCQKPSSWVRLPLGVFLMERWGRIYRCLPDTLAGEKEGDIYTTELLYIVKNADIAEYGQIRSEDEITDRFDFYTTYAVGIGNASRMLGQASSPELGVRAQEPPYRRALVNGIFEEQVEELERSIANLL